jgi:hypothetical protein
MRKKISHYYVLLIILLCSSQSRAQESFITQIIAGWDCTGQAVIANEDGSYTIGGSFNSDSIGKFGNAVIIKTNSDGIAANVKLVTSGIACGITAMAATSDSGYIALGLISHGSNYRVFTSKLTNEGNIQWMVIIDTIMPGNQYSNELGAVCETKDKNFVVATSMQNDSCGTIVVKLSPSGTPVWSRSIKINDSLEGIIPTNIFETTHGDLLLAGHIHPSREMGMGILKMDYLGYPKWQRGVKMDGTTSGNYATKTFDEGVAICGNVSNNVGTFDVGVAKVDSDGNFVWGQRIDGFGNEGCYAIAETSDKSITIGGTQSFADTYPTSDSLIFIRLSPRGELKTFMHSVLPLQSYLMCGLAPSKNGSVTALANSYLIGKAHALNTRAATVLIKIDSGDNVCNFTKPLCQRSTEGKIQSYSASVDSNITITPIKPDTGNIYSAVTQELCSDNNSIKISPQIECKSPISTIISSNENINLPLPKGTNGSFLLTIQNMIAQILQTSNFIIEPKQVNLKINIPRIPPGIYILNFINQNNPDMSFRVKLIRI